MLFASAAPKAVILRRGPKTHWHLIAWDMQKDTFAPGQWMKGLVKLCDLSPDGTKLIYWAAQHHRKIFSAEPVRPAASSYDPLGAIPAARAKSRRKLPGYLRGYTLERCVPAPLEETWTAISTVPYFTALALWPAFGHWTGGGVFLSDREIGLYEPEDRMIPIEHTAIPATVKVRSLLAPLLSMRNASGPSLGKILKLARCAAG